LPKFDAASMNSELTSTGSGCFGGSLLVNVIAASFEASAINVINAARTIGVIMSGSASRAFGGALQARQCAGRAGDEQSTERCLNYPTPPPWREVEPSVESDAGCVGIDRRDLDEFIVRNAERQTNVKRDAMRSHGILHQEPDFEAVTDAGAEHEPVARSQLTVRCVDDLRIHPALELLRRRDEIPHALGRRADDICRTDVEPCG
jgi:hypothetical protein